MLQKPRSAQSEGDSRVGAHSIPTRAPGYLPEWGRRRAQQERQQRRQDAAAAAPSPLSSPQQQRPVIAQATLDQFNSSDGSVSSNHQHQVPRPQQQQQQQQQQPRQLHPCEIITAQDMAAFGDDSLSCASESSASRGPNKNKKKQSRMAFPKFGKLRLGRGKSDASTASTEQSNSNSSLSTGPHFNVSPTRNRNPVAAASIATTFPRPVPAVPRDRAARSIAIGTGLRDAPDATRTVPQNPIERSRTVPQNPADTTAASTSSSSEDHQERRRSQRPGLASVRRTSLTRRLFSSLRNVVSSNSNNNGGVDPKSFRVCQVQEVFPSADDCRTQDMLDSGMSVRGILSVFAEESAGKPSCRTMEKLQALDETNTDNDGGAKKNNKNPMQESIRVKHIMEVFPEASAEHSALLLKEKSLATVMDLMAEQTFQMNRVPEEGETSGYNDFVHSQEQSLSVFADGSLPSDFQ